MAVSVTVAVLEVLVFIVKSICLFDDVIVGSFHFVPEGLGRWQVDCLALEFRTKLTDQLRELTGVSSFDVLDQADQARTRLEENCILVGDWCFHDEDILLPFQRDINVFVHFTALKERGVYLFVHVKFAALKIFD